MNLEDILLDYISQTDKDKYHMSFIICGISYSISVLLSELLDTENRLEIGYCQRWGLEDRGNW